MNTKCKYGDHHPFLTNSGDWVCTRCHTYQGVGEKTIKPKVSMVGLRKQIMRYQLPKLHHRKTHNQYFNPGFRQETEGRSPMKAN